MLGLLLLLCQLQLTASRFLHRVQSLSSPEQPDATHGKALPARVCAFRKNNYIFLTLFLLSNL